MVDVSDWIGPTIGAVGAIGAGASNLVGKKGSAKKQFQYQSALQSQAAQLNYDYSLKYMRDSLSQSPYYNRFGLESAGYNPMLAVSNGTGSSNASSFTTTGSAGSFDYSDAVTEGISNAQSFQRLKNETKTADTQAKANEATAENQSSQALNNLEENKWISSKRKSEIANIQGDTMLKEAQIDNLEKQIELGFAGLSVQKRGQNINNATDLVKSIGAGALGLYGLGKLKLIKPVGDLIKVTPKFINLP